MKAKPGAGLSAPDCVNLQEWGRTNELTFEFLKKEEEIRLTNRSTKLMFKPNSSRAEINGISLFLSSPVVLQQGAPCLAQREVEHALKPIVFPAKGKSGRIRNVVVGAGHGGKDCGYQLGSHQEKEYTLLLAKELAKRLNRTGFKATLIRSGDEFVELEDRPQLAKRAKADIYLELHYNCAGPGNNESRGVEVYCLTPSGASSTNGGSDPYSSPLPGNRHDDRNILLAYQLQRTLVDKLGLVDRGVRRARFVVLREAEMPAALIEAGFMSQPEEMKRIENAGYRRRTAQAIVDALLSYKKLVGR